MKGVDYYYSEFSRIFGENSPVLAEKFVDFTKYHKPNEVYLWLEEKRAKGLLPQSAVDLMYNFFWEIY